MQLLGCSSKSITSSQTEVDTMNIYGDDEEALSVQEPTVNLDSLQGNSTNDAPQHSGSGIGVSVNPFYDEGYEHGHEDGYNDGIENVRGDSYDDSCRYKGKKRKEYVLGYEEGYEAGFDDGFADSGANSEEEE